MKLDEITKDVILTEKRRVPKTKLWGYFDVQRSRKQKETSEKRPEKGIKQKWFPKATEEHDLIRCESLIVLKVAGFITSSWTALTQNTFVIKYSVLESQQFWAQTHPLLPLSNEDMNP